MTASSRSGLLPLAAAFVLLWSSGFVGADLGTRLTGADTLLAWRMLIASTLLLTFCAVTGRRIGRAALRRHVPLGASMQFVYLGGAFLGVQLGVPAATTALVAALQPILVTLAGTLAGGDRLTPPRLAGLGLGFAGVALVVGTSLSGGGAPLWAYACPVVAMLALSIGTFVAGATDEVVDVVTGMTVQTLTAAVGFSAWALLRGDLAAPVTWSFAGAIAWLVVLSGFGGYGTYLLLISRHGPATASVLLYLTPPTTAVWTALMFGEPLSVTALLGMAASLVGVALFLRRPRSSGMPLRPGDAAAATSPS